MINYAGINYWKIKTKPTEVIFRMKALLESFYEILLH